MIPCHMVVTVLLDDHGGLGDVKGTDYFIHNNLKLPMNVDTIF